MATGLCHTDEFTRSGGDPEGIFPSILGHEGAGIVREVGAGVTSVAVGDHVIRSTRRMPGMRVLPPPQDQSLPGDPLDPGPGADAGRTSRFKIGKDVITHYMGCSTFANFTVLPEIAVAKVREDAPFDKICYIGCGVTTGIGAVINTAKVEPGSNVVVFGLGGIGLNVIQARGWWAPT
jgi:S-(hydroxymethyl)glutathione dehydrogenase/alcohol dehydrogenase